MDLRLPFAALIVAASASACSGGGTTSTPPAVGTTTQLTGSEPTPTPAPTPTPTKSPIGAKPTPTPTASASPGRGATPRPPTPTPLPTLLVAGEIYAGPGYSDVSPHQLVRNSRNVLYVAVPSCGLYPACPSNAIAMQTATTASVPLGFLEQDGAHRPTSSSVDGALDDIGSTALAIDGNDVIWVVYNTALRGTHATSFDTSTGRWGPDATIGSTSAGLTTQGREGVAVAIDGSNVPHAAFTFVGSDRAKHVAIATYAGGGWTAPVQVDDAPLGQRQGALHPTIAMTPDNRLLVAWLVGDETAQYNNSDGTIHVRELTGSNYTSGPASVQIPDTNYQGNPGYAATTIDQGPSLMVTADRRAQVSYIDTNDAIRFWYSNVSNYQVWNGDRQPAFQQTHDPSLGPDGSGGLYIYGHGTPQKTKNGHGDNLYRMRLAPNADAWTPFAEIVADRNLDCSVSTRWSQFFDTNPSQVDFTYWNDHYPNQEYVGSF